jgi:hypothetical protein
MRRDMGRQTSSLGRGVRTEGGATQLHEPQPGTRPRGRRVCAERPNPVPDRFHHVPARPAYPAELEAMSRKHGSPRAGVKDEVYCLPDSLTRQIQPQMLLRPRLGRMRSKGRAQRDRCAVARRGIDRLDDLNHMGCLLARGTLWSPSTYCRSQIDDALPPLDTRVGMGTRQCTSSAERTRNVSCATGRKS